MTREHETFAGLHGDNQLLQQGSHVPDGVVDEKVGVHGAEGRQDEVHIERRRRQHHSRQLYRLGEGLFEVV